MMSHVSCSFTCFGIIELKINIHLMHSVVVMMMVVLVVGNNVVSALDWTDTSTGISSASGCVRSLTSDGVIGCTSSRGGDTGVLEYVQESEQLRALLDTAPCYGERYAIVMPYSLLNTINIDDGAINSGIVAGVVVVELSSPSSPYSPDDTVPNRRYDVEKFKWNPTGRNDSGRIWNVPAFTVSGNDATTLVSLALDNPRGCSYPKNAVYFDSYMSAGGDAEICLRRGKCLPIGGQSVWSGLVPGVGRLPSNISATDWILVMAPIDSRSLFYGQTPGYHTTVLPMVMMMTMVDTLIHSSINIPWASLPRYVVVALFDGESYDLVGSRVFEKDLESFKCEDRDGRRCLKPVRSSLAFKSLNISRLIRVINIGELGLETDGTLYLHHDKSDVNSVNYFTELSTLADDLCSADPGCISIGTPSTLNTPASAWNSRHVLHLSDHPSNLNNVRFNSPTDIRVDTTNMTRLCTSVTYLSRAVYGLARNNMTVDAAMMSVRANCSIVSMLTDCLTGASGPKPCQMIQNLLDDEYIADYYPGVFIKESMVAAPSRLVYNYLMTMMGQRGSRCEKHSDCDDDDVESRCISGRCYSGPVYYHRAVPTGLSESGNNGAGLWPWFVLEQSGESLWMESNWPKDPEYSRTKILNPKWGLFTLFFALICVFISVWTTVYVRNYILRMDPPVPLMM